MKTAKSENPLSEILKHWESIRYHKWRVGLGTLGVTLAAAVLVARLPNQYQASTTIIVEPQKIPDTYVQDTVQSKVTDQLSAIKEEVLSAPSLETMIAQYKLYSNRRKSMGPDELINVMRNDITIAVQYATGNSPGAFSITYQGEDPRTVAAVTNQLASQFIEWNLKLREQLAVGTTQFLGQQLDQAQALLAKQEDQIRSFKMGHLGQLPDQEQANLAAISHLQTSLQANSEALDRLEQEKMLLLNQPAGSRPGGTLSASTPDGARALLERQKLGLEAQVQQLERVYSPTFPDVVAVQRQIAQVEKKLQKLGPAPSAAAASGSSPVSGRLKGIAYEMARLNAQQKPIEAEIDAYQQKIDAAPRSEQALSDLTRNYAITKKQYDSLLQKKYQADLAAAMESDQDAQRFSVLDPALVPEKPFKPNRSVLMAGVLLASLVISLALAIGIDMLSPTFKREDELKRRLPGSVKILASVSRIEIPADRRRRIIFAIAAITGSLVACVVVAVFVMGRIHGVL